jgi:hypothetical protein
MIDAILHSPYEEELLLLERLMHLFFCCYSAGQRRDKYACQTVAHFSRSQLIVSLIDWQVYQPSDLH